MPSLRLGIFATGVYAAIISVAIYYFSDLPAGPPDLSGLLTVLLPVQLIAVAFCLFIIVRHLGWRAAGFGRMRWFGMVWFLPGWLVVGVLGWDIVQHLSAEALLGPGVVGITPLILTTFLIAFGEEVMFRGILLRGAMSRVSLPLAMLLSAALFALFHLVNGLAGQDAAQTSQQVLFALMVGFFLAPIAVRVGNLWPLVIWHWIWNIAVMLAPNTGILHPLALAGIAVQAVVSTWLWAAMIRHPQTR